MQYSFIFLLKYISGCWYYHTKKRQKAEKLPVLSEKQQSYTRMTKKKIILSASRQILNLFIYKILFLCYFFCMNPVADENPTRQNIITLLKRSGGMSIDDLSKKISITPMGIRQHLLSLEKKGIVTYIAKKHGIGRPGFIYMLTDAADDLFSSPRSFSHTHTSGSLLS